MENLGVLEKMFCNKNLRRQEILRRWLSFKEFIVRPWQKGFFFERHETLKEILLRVPISEFGKSFVKGKKNFSVLFPIFFLKFTCEIFSL